MDLKYRIQGSNEIREKLYQKLKNDEEFVLLLDLDRIEKLGYFE